MEILFHPYELSSGRKGALLSCALSGDARGYADCHPLPSFGDVPLATHLSLLKERKETSLVARALSFARLDAEARKEGRSLFAEKSIPASHFFCSDLSSLSLDDLHSQGFTRIKKKIGKSPDPQLRAKMDEGARLGIRWRLDANECFTKRELDSYLKELAPVLSSIDFMEDPCPFDLSLWEEIQKEWGVALACDREVLRAVDQPAAASVLVFKPAREEVVLPQVGQRIVITSCLDHPLGQLAAAHVAAELEDSVDLCGLSGPECTFSLRRKGPHLLPPAGAGFGFQKQLEEIPWRRL